jgi:U6 snRNA-associated Sm-like protein LSm4
MLVELKNGDTYNGRLEQCDSWMNVKLLEVIWTSRDGDRFWKLPEVYIRGNSIKYMTIPNEVLDMVAEEEESKEGMSCSSMRFSESKLSTEQ